MLLTIRSVSFLASMNSATLANLPKQPASRPFSDDTRIDTLALLIQIPSESPVPIRLPLYACKVPAGFPSPADDHLEASLDLNQRYIKHPAATFFVKVQGDSMIDAGIHNGDTLIVDRSLPAQSGSIVVAVVNGELTVKRLLLDKNGAWLMPENAQYLPMLLKEGLELHIWGVVAHVIHSL